MRVAQMDYELDAIAQQLWKALDGQLCEPVEWIPFHVWMENSSTYLEGISKSPHIDLLPDLYAMAQGYTKYARFTMPVYASSLEFLVPNANVFGDTQEAWFSLHSTVSVFSTPIWLILVVLLVSMCCLNTAAFRTSKSPLSGWRWFMHFSLEDSTGRVSGRQMVLRVVMVSTGLFTIHSLNLYQGCLLSRLVTETPYHPAVSSFEDVVQKIRQKQMMLNLVDSTYVFPQVLYDTNLSNGSVLAELRDVLSENPPVYWNIYFSQEHERLLQETESTGVVVISAEVMFYNNLMLKNRKVCDKLYVPIPEAYNMVLLASPEIDPEKLECLNEAMVHNLQYIMNRAESILEEKQRDYEACRAELIQTQSGHPGDPIRLVKLSGTLTIVLGGTLTALVAFGLERLRYDLEWRVKL